jgi:hypothetical protein
MNPARVRRPRRKEEHAGAHLRARTQPAVEPSGFAAVSACTTLSAVFARQPKRDHRIGAAVFPAHEERKEHSAGDEQADRARRAPGLEMAPITATMSASSATRL